jgi:uncharacterized protein YegL
MSTNGTPHTNGSAPKPDALHVAFVLDKSGSMSHLARAVVTGFDEFLDELRKGGGDTLFTLTMFDTEFEHVHVATPLADVPPLAKTGYRPGGMTALFDAVAHAVIDTDKRLAAEGRGDDKVLVVVMTDGLENSSTDFTAETIAELVAGYDERPNWTFVYLGAAHATLEDARDAAGMMAFKRANAMRWTADEASARKSMGSLAAATKQRRAARDMKSEQLFADAGQGEADYRGDAPADGAAGQSSPITRRNISDMFGPNGGREGA